VTFRRGQGELVLLALLLSDALALTSQQGGPALDLGVGLGVGAPFEPRIGGHLGLGWWVGTYDDQYAFGKYWALGPSIRFDFVPGRFDLVSGSWSAAPMLELRRGIELIVVGVAPFVAGGPVLASVEGAQPALGWTARTGVNLKLRRTRFWGLTTRLELGAEGVGDRVGFAGGLLVGGAFARPAHEIKGPEL
jgi:hypothetical protein